MPFFIRKTITVLPSLCDPQPFALHLYVTQFLTTDFQSEILRKILNHFKMLILRVLLINTSETQQALFQLVF